MGDTPSTPAVLTVSEFLESVRTLLDNRYSQIAVRGEITNFKAASSGHIYFSLKDERGRVDCAFFRGYNQALAFKPVDGLQVVVGGAAGLYEARGQFQLTVRWMEPAGLGALQLAFEQLKRKLQEEGLFDPSRKRPLPKYPRRVAVITSAEGAAWKDFLRILESRVGIEEIDLYDVRVQGSGAPSEITAALVRIADWPEYDVVVLTRGGGSAEDLAAFNDEAVVRAVAACPVPVVSAVGHEIDTTLCDFAADKRAPTPTAAAEWLAPDRADVAKQLLDCERRLRDSLANAVGEKRAATEDLVQRMGLFHPSRRLDEDRQRVDELTEDLSLALRNARAFAKERLAGAGAALARNAPILKLAALREKIGSHVTALRHGAQAAVLQQRSRLDGAVSRLEAYHPLSPLKRGYALVTRTTDGKVLSASSEVSKGDLVDIRLADGRLEAEVKKVFQSP